jgi:amidase
VLSVLGPLANSLGAVKSFMKSVVSQKPWLKDPLAVRKPWSEEEYGLVEHGHGKNLCFAILWNDEVMVPHPPIQRGLEEAKSALVAVGHKSEDFSFLRIFPYISNSNRLETLETYGNIQDLGKCPPRFGVMPYFISLVVVSNSREQFGKQEQAKTTASPPSHPANPLSQL